MSNAVAVRKETVPALSMTEDELMSVLKNSLYPGAKDESIKLVIGYCRASNLDPMQKPVHIVPMSVSTGQKDNSGWDIKEMRDVVMPGIGLYRTQAARSGEYAGVSEPEFGDDLTEELDGVMVTYPKWCKVIVRRQMANGAIVDFSAKELWKENYATKSSKSAAPNAMWKKRPYAQLAKCAEAQALRKAFPEIGAQPTADEMEGKTFDDTVIDASAGELSRKVPVDAARISAPASYDQAKFDANKDAWREVVVSGRKTPDQMVAFIESRGNPLTEEQKLSIDAWSHEND
jgi:phage recombination protein Bet